MDFNTATIKVTQDFIDQRDERSKKYNPRGRDGIQLKNINGKTILDGKSMEYVQHMGMLMLNL